MLKPFEIVLTIVVTIMAMVIVIFVFFVPASFVLSGSVSGKLSQKEIDKLIFNDSTVFFKPFIAENKLNYLEYRDIEHFDYNNFLEEISFLIKKRYRNSTDYFKNIHHKSELAGWKIVHDSGFVRKYCYPVRDFFNKAILEYKPETRRVNVKIKTKVC